MQINLEKNLSREIINKPSIKLKRLKAHNYHTWAINHKRFFKNKSLIRILTKKL